MDMIQSKFIQYYQLFHKKERIQLRKWAASPLHTPNQAVKALIDYVIDARSLNKRNLNPQRVFAAIYGKALPYDDLKMRHLLSNGVQSLQKFVQFLAQESIPISSSKNAIFWYQQRHHTDFANDQLKKAQQQLPPYSDGDFYYHQYCLEVAAFELQGTQTRSSQTNLQPILDHLEHHFTLQLLRWSCTALTHQNVYKVKYQFSLIEAVLTKAKTGAYTEQPTIMAYYHAYGCLTTPDQIAYFNALKEQLLTQAIPLPTNELRSLFLIAINYCIKRLNKEVGVFFLRELFELYQAALEREVLLEEGYLSPFSYANINALALRLKEFEWSAHFIAAYAPLLRTGVRQAYHYHATAKLAFAQGDYNRAQHLLLNSDYSDVLLTIDARIMLLKIYYAHDQHDLLEALLVSLSRYLERQKMLSYHKTNYRNIIRLVRRLLYLAPYDTANQDKWQQEVQDTHPLTERAWLLEQLEQL